MTYLTPEQVEKFESQGLLALPNFLSSDQVAQLLARSHKLINDFDLSSHPLTKFTTGTKGEEHVGDAYFLDSSDKVSFFFEPDAFDSTGATLTKPKERSINKIGHGLHMLDDVFNKYTINNKTVSIAKDLGFTDPRVLQSMLICKQPEIGGEVPPHQDAVFLNTKPQSAIGFWIALEDCTTSNGCLSYLPGSHKVTPVSKRFVRKNGGGTGFISVDTPLPSATKADSDEEYIEVECPAGSLVLIHNSVLHKSNKNTSNRSRFAYTFHVIDGTSEYDDLNWLQVPSTGGTNFTKLELATH